MKLLAAIINKVKQFYRQEDAPEYEITQFVFSDKQRIDGKSIVSFFVNNSEPDISVTRTFENEDEAVNWLMADNDFRRMLFGNIFPSSNWVHYRCGVKEPITIANKMPGDIDILLYEDRKAENSIGIECKIVKSESRKNQPPKINKIASRTTKRN